MKHVAAFLLFGLAAWWLWLLLVGEWNRTEWIAATAAATIAAAIGEIARTRADASPGLPLRVLASAPAALGMVFVDFALVMWALARRRGGVFRTTSTGVAGNEQSRAWATYLATISPNAYVVDLDADRATALTHHLVPLQSSQEPV